MVVRHAFTKNDYAYEEVRNRILTGELAAGSIIPQGRLAEELGVSTTPLREAVRRLTAEGLIVLEAHRDARVAALSADEARHLYEVRESVDPLAAGLAAQRRSESDLERIRAAESSMTPLQGTATTESLVAHREFHRAIYRASGNPLLVDILERLWDKADRYRLVGLRSRGDSQSEIDRVEREHREIAEAVETGDSDRALQAMKVHISGSLGRRAIGVLEEGGERV